MRPARRAPAPRRRREPGAAFDRRWRRSPGRRPDEVLTKSRRLGFSRKGLSRSDGTPIRRRGATVTPPKVPVPIAHPFTAMLEGVPGEAISGRRACRAQAPRLLAALVGIALLVAPATAQTEPKPPATYPALPSEIPARFVP